MFGDYRVDAMAAVENVPHSGLDADHLGYAWTVHVRIEYPHFHVLLLQGCSQINHNTGFADTSLATHHGNFVIDMGHSVFDGAVCVA